MRRRAGLRRRARDVARRACDRFAIDDSGGLGAWHGGPRRGGHHSLGRRAVALAVVIRVATAPSRRQLALRTAFAAAAALADGIEGIVVDRVLGQSRGTRAPLRFTRSPNRSVRRSSARTAYTSRRRARGWASPAANVGPRALGRPGRRRRSLCPVAARDALEGGGSRRRGLQWPTAPIPSPVTLSRSDLDAARGTPPSGCRSAQSGRLTRDTSKSTSSRWVVTTPAPRMRATSWHASNPRGAGAPRLPRARGTLLRIGARRATERAERQQKSSRSARCSSWRTPWIRARARWTGGAEVLCPPALRHSLRADASRSGWRSRVTMRGPSPVGSTTTRSRRPTSNGAKKSTRPRADVEDVRVR